MGKHEAPAPEKRRAPKHAVSDGTAKKFDLHLPEFKKPDFSKIKDLVPVRKLFSGHDREEEDEDYEDDEEPEDEVRIYESKKRVDEPVPVTDEPTKKMKPAEASELAAEAGAEAGNGAEPEESPEPQAASRRERRPDKPASPIEAVRSWTGWQSIRRFFEKLASYGVNDEKNAYQRSYGFNREHVFITAGTALLFFVLWLLPTRGTARNLLYLFPLIILSAYPFLDAVGELLNKVFPGRNLLAVAAALGFLCLGQAHVAVFVMLVYRMFVLIECYLYEKKESMLEELGKSVPDTAVAETESGLDRRDARSFKVGDTVFVPVGDPIPLDGVVTEGISTLDTSVLCGRGSNADVGPDCEVCAGCLNLTNPLKVRVTRAYDDTMIRRYAARTEQAVSSFPSRFSLAQRVLDLLPVCLAGLGVVLALVGSIVTGSWSVWLGRGFLLIALAAVGDLLLSARMAYFTGVFDALKEGISFRSADAIDRYASSDTMIFSKTGTVTEGKYSVVGVYPVDYEEKDLLTIAALAECQSTHPIAQALRDACGIDVHHRDDITLLEDTPGRGIHTLFGGRNVYVGNSTLLIDHNIVFDVPAHKGTVIHVAVDNKYAGCIVLNDKIREGAFDAIEELRLRGIRATVMLTGDVRTMARPIASSLSFDMVKCELSTENKREALDYLKENKGNTAAIAYVSSKDADSELLERADVGVGFHALSAYRLLETASVLIPGSTIFMIPQSLFLAKRISLAALLNACLMLGLTALLAILGILGIVNAWFALLLILLARVGTLIYSIYFK